MSAKQENRTTPETWVTWSSSDPTEAFQAAAAREFSQQEQLEKVVAKSVADARQEAWRRFEAQQKMNRYKMAGYDL